jgi:hypothetical protein
LNAIQALSQLSYSPTGRTFIIRKNGEAVKRRSRSGRPLPRS